MDVEGLSWTDTVTAAEDRVGWRVRVTKMRAKAKGQAWDISHAIIKQKRKAEKSADAKTPAATSVYRYHLQLPAVTNPAGTDTDQPGPDPPPPSSANITTKTGPTQTDIRSFFPPKFNSQLLNYFPARRQPTSDSSCNGNCEHDVSNDNVSNDNNSDNNNNNKNNNKNKKNNHSNNGNTDNTNNKDNNNNNNNNNPLPDNRPLPIWKRCGRM